MNSLQITLGCPIQFGCWYAINWKWIYELRAWNPLFWLCKPASTVLDEAFSHELDKERKFVLCLDGGQRQLSILCCITYLTEGSVGSIICNTSTNFKARDSSKSMQAWEGILYHAKPVSIMGALAHVCQRKAYVKLWGNYWLLAAYFLTIMLTITPTILSQSRWVITKWVPSPL